MSDVTADLARAEAARRSQSRLNLLLSLTLLGLLLLLWTVLAVSTRNFLTEINITNLMRQAYLVAILAVGQTFVIITGGIDLSVGAVIGFCSVILALLLKAPVAIPVAILLTLALGALIGAFHGFGIVQLGLPPFIMTLATLTALRGMGFLITNGSTISGLPEDFTAFAPSSFLGIPSLFWMVIVVGVPSYVFLHHTRWGRYLFAIGSNPEAARLTGINVKRMIYVAYILSAFLAAVAAVLTTSRLSIGTQNTGQGLELQAIAASVIGGTSVVRRGRQHQRAAARQLPADHHRQRRQPAERQPVLAADHHRRADHRDRIPRPAPPASTLNPTASATERRCW